MKRPRPAGLFHVELRARSFRRSRPFYDWLMFRIGWRSLYRGAAEAAWTNGVSILWLLQVERRHRALPFHRKRAGLNHIAFRVSARAHVDRFAAALRRRRPRSILYGGPRDYPEYGGRYYACFFEDPDRIKLEVAYRP